MKVEYQTFRRVTVIDLHDNRNKVLDWLWENGYQIKRLCPYRRDHQNKFKLQATKVIKGRIHRND